jgi:hypothetical protein
MTGYNLHDIVIGMADKALDILVPRFAEEYNLDLHKPSLNTSTYDYMGGDAGIFYPFGEYGMIKLEQEFCSHKTNCCEIVSHEMGHAGFYQNFPLYTEFNEKDEKGCFLLLNEGVSERFMKQGLKILKDEKHISYLGYYRKSLGNTFWGRAVKGVMLPDKYYIGELVVNSYIKRGVKLKDIILRADEFKKDLEKRGWEEAVRFYSKPSIKVLEKI